MAVAAVLGAGGNSLNPSVLSAIKRDLHAGGGVRGLLTAVALACDKSLARQG